MKYYTQNLLELVHQLRGLGKLIPYDAILAILLCDFLESYDSLITIITMIL